MGSRGRSIRLRIYFLVAIPLVAMVGLLAYVAGTSVNNAINLDRAPSLINATSVPAANFVNYLQAERAAAVVYLFQPTAANLAAYQTAVAATNTQEPAFKAALTSPATVGSETPAIAEQINAAINGLGSLSALRQGVMARALSPLQALGAYSQGIGAAPKLFLAEAASITDATAASQALGLIGTVSVHEALSQEDALLSGVLAGRRMTAADRSAFIQMASGRQGYTVDYQALFTPSNLAVYNAGLKGTEAQQNELAGVEQAVAAGLPPAKLPVTLPQWQALANTLLKANFNAGLADAAAQLTYDHKVTRAAWLRVALSGSAGLLGVLITIVVTTLVGRGIIRRLGGLEDTALQLAEVQLPDVVGRLRRGEDVDLASEAPPLRVGGDEIGRVGQAFDLVRQTAIRAAVEEARLRHGLNDVFRSLARRSQSLLHRQLTLLDQMERRATDPEALDDLFRLDHLTTRMRRHAEGLVILAGAPPGRGWSSPVRMVDVMRGAIAEVEDYARVSVATRSQAALSGSAVADVIHLLAELIENATTLSPPYTSVRVSGETVASGFAVEVEDRGLGMSPQRMAELNERLANPPEFNPSDSEQLGLFVVGQLARRHGIKVTLKASPYGGTSAIVLIPQHLVVTEDTLRSLPGEPAAIGMSPPAANGNNGSAAPPGGLPPLRGVPGLAETPGVRISGALRRSPGPGIGAGEGVVRGAPAALGQANGFPPGTENLPRRHRDPQADAASADPASGKMSPGSAVPFESGGMGPAAYDGSVPPMTPGGRGQGEFDVFEPRRRGGSAAGDPAAYSGGGTSPQPAPDPGSPPYPGSASAPYQGAGSAPYSDQPSPFPAWARRNPAGGTSGYPAGPGGPAGPATPMTPVASARTPAGPPWEMSPQTGPPPAVPAGPDPGSPAAPDAEGGYKGLPRRVKQASLAPQLRADPPHLRAPQGGGISGGPTPAEIRKTMSALQRGWEEGRSQQAAGPPESSSPSGPSGLSGPSGPGPADAGDGDSTGPDSAALDSATE